MKKRHNYANTPVAFIAHVATERGEKEAALLKLAVDFYDNVEDALLEKGIDIAAILLDLGLDTETLAVAIAYPALQAGDVHLDSMTDVFGEPAYKLLRDVLQMQSLGKVQDAATRGNHQLENLRKMLFAMMTDVRAVLIILAERLWLLDELKTAAATEQKKFAAETLAVYAPLANRLGVWQLKWAIEDGCLRYLEPEIYNTIAKSLATRRVEREIYLKQFVDDVTERLQATQLTSFQVYGRAKHIYSIYNKMQRKESRFADIYDITAVRILVASIDDCYRALGILQTAFQQLPDEFSDYIAQPKPNGYRSIHMVVMGPENRYIEIQIRTEAMHHESELGVAAHWRYKEGVLQTSNYEAKIALLRQVMAWQREVSNVHPVDAKHPVQDLFADRIYVFTPAGDIIDLPQGATPIDFAYAIHREVGHRCRGAKVDGKMVQLTYVLQTGQRVDILTGKQEHPSRDWINPHLGYVKTARARAAIQHWFRVRESAAPQEVERTATLATTAFVPRFSEHKPAMTSSLLGINKLLTHVAKCCKPLPGDAVIGYITRGRGVSIHRVDCNNMQSVQTMHQQRFIEIAWGEKEAVMHTVELQLRVQQKTGTFRDITTLLANAAIHIVALQTQKSAESPEVLIYLSIEIMNVQQLNKAIALLKKIPDISDIRRR